VFYPGICLTTEEKARKNLSQGSQRMPVGTKKTFGTTSSLNTWVISKVLHTVWFLFKNEFILQNTLQAFNVISIVLHHSGPTCGQVL
jgi:hypothetical protein